MSLLSRSLLAASASVPSVRLVGAPLVRAGRARYGGLRGLHLTPPLGKTELTRTASSSTSKHGEQAVDDRRDEKAEREVRDMSRIDDLLNEIGRSVSHPPRIRAGDSSSPPPLPHL
jgi:hypothetical protein